MTSITIPKTVSLSLHHPRLFPSLAFIAVLLLISLFFVWSRLQFTHLEYAISSLEGHQRDMYQESNRLRLEVASLRHPGRIEHTAKTQMGLSLPNPTQVISIN